MDTGKKLYIMISKTDTGIGMIIRKLSHYPYNHVALTLNDDLRNWVSFGRYAHDAPLYAGFIPESVERYLAKGYDVPVRIFEIPISNEKHRTLQELFSVAGNRQCGLIYNSFDAFAAVFRRKVKIPGAYTCLSFACAVLQKRYITIEALDEDLAPFLVYDGPLSDLIPDSGSRTDRYFGNLGLVGGTWSSAKQFAALSYRSLRHKGPDIVAQQMHWQY